MPQKLYNDDGTGNCLVWHFDQPLFGPDGGRVWGQTLSQHLYYEGSVAVGDGLLAPFDSTAYPELFRSTTFGNGILWQASNAGDYARFTRTSAVAAILGQQLSIDAWMLLGPSLLQLGQTINVFSVYGGGTGAHVWLFENPATGLLEMQFWSYVFTAPTVATIPDLSLSALGDGGLHHVAFVQRGITSTLEIWVDGVMEAQSAAPVVRFGGSPTVITAGMDRVLYPGESYGVGLKDVRLHATRPMNQSEMIDVLTNGPKVTMI